MVWMQVLSSILFAIKSTIKINNLGEPLQKAKRIITRGQSKIITLLCFILIETILNIYRMKVSFHKIKIVGAILSSVIGKFIWILAGTGLLLTYPFPRLLNGPFVSCCYSILIIGLSIETANKKRRVAILILGGALPLIAIFNNWSRVGNWLSLDLDQYWVSGLFLFSCVLISSGVVVFYRSILNKGL
jgi:hypothetical protein